MRVRMTVLVVIVAVVVAAGAWVGWMVRYRPLTVFAWQTRAALRTAGLRKVHVAAPAGEQTVFVGGQGSGGRSPARRRRQRRHLVQRRAGVDRVTPAHRPRPRRPWRQRPALGTDRLLGGARRRQRGPRRARPASRRSSSSATRSAPGSRWSWRATGRIASRLPCASTVGRCSAATRAPESCRKTGRRPASRSPRPATRRARRCPISCSTTSSARPVRVARPLRRHRGDDGPLGARRGPAAGDRVPVRLIWGVPIASFRWTTQRSCARRFRRPNSSSSTGAATCRRSSAPTRSSLPSSRRWSRDLEESAGKSAGRAHPGGRRASNGVRGSGLGAR